MNISALSLFQFRRFSILIAALLLSTSVIAQPVFTKVFDPGSAAAGIGRDAIGPGSTTTLRFDIDNSGSASGVTGVGFTDILPTEIVLADPASAFTDCADGVISFPAPAGTTISLSGARLGAGDVCSVTVNVTSNVVGDHANTSGDLMSSLGSTPGATASLMIDATLLGFSKSFEPSAIPLGGTSVLTFTFDNSAAGAVDQFSARFLDDLPAGMVIATPANASTDCIASTFPNTTLTAVSGTSFIQLFAFGRTFPPGFCPPFCDDPLLMAGSTCTVTVDVTTDITGVFPNIARLPLGALNENDGFATAALDVPREFLSKSFTDDPVAPDGFVTLDFTVTNLDRVDSVSDFSFDDPLPAGLTFDSLASDDCGGILDTATASLLKYSGGGTLLPEAACTLSVRLKVPAAASIGSFTNTTTAIMVTIGGIGVTGNTATDVLVISTAPVLTKEFLDATTMATDPVVNAGDDVIVSFSITNTSTTSGATDIVFEDFFDSVLATASVTPGDGCCGAGSICTFTPLINIPFEPFISANLVISGGSLAPAGMAGDSCTFSLTLDVGVDAEAGIYPNTTGDISATVDGATQTGDPASASFSVISAPSLSKAFSDDPVTPGGTVTLEFTLSHSPDAPGDATGIMFSDDLTFLTGLTVSGLPLTQVCDPDLMDALPGTGTLSSSAGDTLLTFLDGTLSPGQSCTFSVTLDVPAGAAPGTITNTTSGVGATVGGLATTSAPASADLGVFGLTFSKQFIGDPVMAGDTVTLEFTLNNTSLTDDVTSIFFGDDLGAVLPGLAPSGMLPATPCGPSSTLTFSGTSLSFGGGELAAGDMCTFSVTLLVPGGTLDGSYPNSTNFNFAVIGATPVFLPPATDQLIVSTTRLALSKAFINDPVTPGGAVTLEFTLTNLDAGQAASAIAFTDLLADALAGLTFDSVEFNDCGATVSGTGTTTITVEDAALGAGGTCTIRVSLTVPGGTVPGFYTNTTSAVSGMIGGSGVSGTAASDILQLVDLLLFSKSFDATTTAGGTPKLTFVITNPGSGTAIDVFFSDDLNGVFTGLIETNLPLFDICGLGSTLTSTSNTLLELNGGTLPPSGGVCSFEVDLAVPATATVGVFTNTTSELFQAGLRVADPATDDLTVVNADLSVTKDDGLTFATLGGSVVYTIVATNNGPSDDPIVMLSDALPTDLTCTFISVAAGGATGNTSGSGDLAQTLFMPAGSTVTYTVTCMIPANATGTLSNTVTVAGSIDPGIGNNSATDNNTVLLPQADLAITKTDGVTSATPGGSVVYTIVATNNGPSDDPSVMLSDTFPTDLTCTFTSVAAGGATGNTSGSGDLVQTLTMPSGSSVTYTVTCTIAANATGTLTNTAAITASVVDLATGNNSATDSDTVLVPQADLAITKTDGVTSAVPGQSLTYTIVASNDGPSDAPSATLTDTFPSVLTCTYTSVAVNGAMGNTAGSGDLSETLSLPAGSSVTYTVTCTIDADATGTLSNTATLSGSAPDPVAGNNSATDSDTVLGPMADLAITKTDGVTAATPGSTLTYTIVASNAGPSDDPAASVDDAFPVELTCNYTSVAAGGATGNTSAGSGNIADTLSLPASSSVTYTASCVIDVAATGTLSNTATITTSVIDPAAGNNSATDSDTALAPQAVSLSLVKDFTDDPVAPGGTVTLEFTVTNDAASAATDISFSDDLDAFISGLTVSTPLPTNVCGPGSNLTDSPLTLSNGNLAGSGASCTFAVSLTLPLDAVPGRFTNTTSNLTGTISGTPKSATSKGGPVTVPPAVADLDVVSIVLSKAFIDDPITAGDTIGLVFMLSNPSTVDAIDISFTDDLDAVFSGLTAVGPPRTMCAGPARCLL